MVKQLLYKNSNKKGLSAIITTLILIALSIVAVALVWTFISVLIKGNIKSSEACFGNYEKITINPDYTCYEQIGGNYYLRFALSIGDITPEEVVVSVSSSSEVKSYRILSKASSVAGLTMYPTGNTSVILPGKNSGLTYRTEVFTGKFDMVRIAPVLDGTQCDVSDTISEIADCTLMV